MKRPIGLHIRNNKNLGELLKQVVELNVPFFQCFLRQQSGQIIEQEPVNARQFRSLTRQMYPLFVHASYRINLADYSREVHPALKQEIHWTKKFGFTHLILHPGAGPDYNKGIDAIARVLNNVMKQHPEVQFVLENVAFSSPSLGGNLQDFYAIKAKLDEPEKIGFCIDTAHAFAYGYDCNDEHKRAQFFEELNRIIGIEQILLIHLNNTQSELASHNDIHCLLTAGNITLTALKGIATHPLFEQIPLLLELPNCSQAEALNDLMLVQSWF